MRHDLPCILTLDAFFPQCCRFQPRRFSVVH
jgi:hypothetical protein